MGHQYLGNPAAFPASYQIPDDGDAKNAASMNVGLEALGDRTAWLKANLPYLQAITVLATGNIVVPPQATQLFYSACGGGAGGAGGSAAVGIDRNATGGGGGGGALRCEGSIEVVPGETLAITIGAGGIGGAGGISNGTAAQGGGNGGFTTIVRPAGSVLLAAMSGAHGGGVGLFTTTGVPGLDTLATVTFNGVATEYYSFAAGGAPISDFGLGPLVGVRSLDHTALLSLAPHSGGRGTGAKTPSTSYLRGGSSLQGFFGGSGGSSGLASATYLGGGPGGGGGGGPYGAGGFGANGGNGNSSGNATNGTPGGSALANTGGGGGGGGASGCSNNAGSTGAGSGGAGGNGGSGRITMIFLRGL